MRKIILCSTIVLTSFFFTNCQKEKPNEETPIKPTEKGIPATAYKLSEDKKSLLKWNDNSVSTIDFTTDPVLRNVTHIAANTFSGCTALTQVKLTDKIEHIGEFAFYKCSNLSDFVMSNNEHITKIERGTFQDCSKLTYVKLSPYITTIGILAFADSGINKIELPENFFSIEKQAFAGCVNLKEIEIPKNVSDISTAAFEDSGLVKITLYGTFPPKLRLGERGAGFISPFPPSLTDIIVPKEATQDYRDKKEWHYFAAKINRHLGFKPLTLSQTEFMINEGEFVDFSVESGNGDYKIVQSEESKVIVAYAQEQNNKARFRLFGQKKGATTLTFIDEISQTQKTLNVRVVTPFTLTPNVLRLSVGETKTIAVTGNGNYQIAATQFAQITYNATKSELVVKGLQRGNEEVIITDTFSGKRLAVEIIVN